MSAEDQIRQFAERIVRLEEERKALANDIKDVKAEAKAAGFSPKLIATCVRIMLLEAEKRAEALAGHEELDLYLSAVGLVGRREVHETRQDAGGSGYAVPAMAARAAARDEAGADVIRETDASVSATQDAAPSNSPGSQDAGQPDRDRKASDEAPEGDYGDIQAGQSEECVTTAGAVEALARADEAASASDPHSHDGGSL
ncbi:DUF2312 domain-containing protein [Methylobacterium organophilum]|jgi:uncharacterized protein (UPF0335 family)|uniref:GapR family DNA-binding domain-containing protein n=1 Tax=Methylobacterium organophilum TaxID=410 RepID=UPI0019D22875|nr:DUF2312 domain-containing protein [Methylobacterium organophilum]